LCNHVRNRDLDNLLRMITSSLVDHKHQGVIFFTPDTSTQYSSQFKRDNNVLKTFHYVQKLLLEAAKCKILYLLSAPCYQ